MDDPSPSSNERGARLERSVSEGIQRAVIRIACATFAIIIGTFAIIAGALAGTDQLAYLAVGAVAIGVGLAVIRVELRRKRELEQH
jgi:hypothetical protein